MPIVHTGLVLEKKKWSYLRRLYRRKRVLAAILNAGKAGNRSK